MDKEIEALLVPNQKAATFLWRIAMLGSIFTAAIGILCLLGWQFNVPLLKSFFPTTVAMNPLSAIGFVCIGGILFLQVKNRDMTMNTWKEVINLVLIASTILIGFMALLAFFNKTSGIDEIFFTEKLAGNRISPNTSISFLLIGVALLFAQFPLKKYFSRIAQILTLIVATLSMFAIIGYAYQAFSLYQLLSFTPMPLSSAITFAVICITLLSSLSNHGYIKILTKNSPSSRLALRLIFITLTLPAILGYFLLLSEESNLFNVATGVAFFVITTTLLFSILIWINSRQLQKQELENLIIKNELEKENVTLKINAKQLADKAMQLEEKKGETYDFLVAGTLHQETKPPSMGD